MLPCPAQFVQVVLQDAKDAPDLTPRESIVLPEIRRSGRTAQVEDRLATAPYRAGAFRAYWNRGELNMKTILISIAARSNACSINDA